ncbi:GGDEF domain-containing protein [Glutamicibacter arilaitensis]|uniref:GGDEF domain-containing protein n=1 Tax=Glutamicibacter arilaitensis TaxID=256701 RepID=UPI00384ECD69
MTALVAFFMFFFYLLNLFQPLDFPDQFVVRIARCVGALGVLSAAIIMRNKFPLWLGYLGALAEVASFVYFVGFTMDHEQVVFRLQEFPLIAMYLSWLFPSWLTRLTIYPVMAFTIPYSVFVGPAAGTEHSQGLLNVFALMFFTILGTSVGTFVRRRFRNETEFDVLTGALNRRGLSVHGEPALARSLRFSKALTVALVDLDGFKLINDEQGHTAGDEVLKQLVKHWLQTTRKSDIVCRLGGDEFVLVFPNTSFEEAQVLMARIKETSNHAWSYGLAQAHKEDNLSTVILRADRAMYEAKRQRNGLT